MVYRLFCKVYDSGYPKNHDVVFELDEPFHCESRTDALKKGESVILPILKVLFPDNMSSSGVEGEGFVWTITDVM